MTLHGCLRSGQLIEDLRQHIFSLAASGYCLVREPDPVQYDVFGQRKDVFGDHVVTIVQESARSRGGHQCDSRSGRTAQFDLGVVSSPVDQVDAVTDENLADVHLEYLSP